MQKLPGFENVMMKKMQADMLNSILDASNEDNMEDNEFKQKQICTKLAQYLLPLIKNNPELQMGNDDTVRLISCIDFVRRTMRDYTKKYTTKKERTKNLQEEAEYVCTLYKGHLDSKKIKPYLTKYIKLEPED